MRKLSIYTDGSTIKNPGPGGWAAILVTEKDNYYVLSEASETEKTTNNIMEMMGVIRALEFLPEPCEITVYSDSQYVVRGMNEWIHGWKLKNFFGVKNVELWKRLDKAAKKHKVKFKWVKGHNGDRYNEIADQNAYRVARQKWM